jgi:hypothetical protein
VAIERHDSSFSSGLTAAQVGNVASPEFQRTVTPNAKTPAHGAGGKRYAIAKIGQARQALADLLMSYARLVQATDDSGSRQQLRAELSSLLLDKDPELLSCILEIAGKQRSASAPRVLDLYLHLKAVAERYQAAQVPDDDPAWADLRTLAETLLAPYQARAEEIIGKIPLSGALDKVLPDWLTKASAALSAPAAAERVHGMLALSPAHLLDSETFRTTIDVLDELVVAGMEGEAETLATHVSVALKSVNKDDRIKAVRALAVVIENLMDQSARVVAQLETALLATCARETSEAVLVPVVQYLLARACSLYNRGYFQRATVHADTIDLLERSYRKALGDEAVNPVREACAELARSAWAQALPEALAAGGEREAAAARMLAAIDKNLATTLIACIGREENLPRAQVYAKHLKILCPGSAKPLFTLLNSQNDPVALARMLAVAPMMGADEEVMNLIFPLLVHSNFELRGSALQFILDRDNERTAMFIGMRLRDPRCAPQRDLWMSILTRLRHPAVAQVLLSELQSELDAPAPDDRRLLALVESCNGYDDPRLGAALLRFLRPGAGVGDTRRITVTQRENGRAVKLAAMKGLIRYQKDPRVYELLERMRREPDPDIARMAAYCLSAPADLQLDQAQRTGMSQGAPRTDSSFPTGSVGMGVPVRGMPGQPARPPVARGFEALESAAQADALFKPGQTISGKHTRLPDAPPTDDGVLSSGKQTPLDPSQLPEDLFAGAKPLLEGELQDLGLGMTARITCAKNGVMLIKSSLGKGAIYIQNKTVIAAFFSGMTEIQALAAIGKLKAAQFAYYAKSFRYEASMNIEVSNIETAIREYLDMR